LDLKELSRGILSWVALVAAALATGVVAGCGGGSSPGSGSGPVPGENTQLTVVASSTANDQLVHFGVALNGLSLTNKAGTTVPVLSTPQEVEFIHLNGSAEPLATVSVPQDVYTSATVTVGSALFKCVAYDLSESSDWTADYAYGYTLISQVTTQLPEPLTVDGDTMAVSLEMLVSQSASFPSTCYYTGTGIATFSITPTFNLVAMTVSAQPTNPMNGKLTALEGLVVNPGAGSGSFTVAAADGSPVGTTLSTIWNVNTNGSTAYQGIGSAGALTAGMAVDLDGTLQANGSVLATRVAVPDTYTTNLVVNRGPLMDIPSSVPILQQVNQEAEGSQEFIDGWGGYNYSNATFATWGGIMNVASLPFAASFDAATMVPGQMVAITSHVTSVAPYPAYVPATVVTLMPQTIDGTVEAVGTANAFTTYTIQLAPYDVFPQFAVQGGQTTLLTSPLQVVVYADQNTQMLTAPAVGSALRFTGVIFNDNGTLRMDCTQVAGGVAE
jgi:hypothetical protein